MYAISLDGKADENLYNGLPQSSMVIYLLLGLILVLEKNDVLQMFGNPTKDMSILDMLKEASMKDKGGNVLLMLEHALKKKDSKAYKMHKWIFNENMLKIVGRAFKDKNVIDTLEQKLIDKKGQVSNIEYVLKMFGEATKDQDVSNVKTKYYKAIAFLYTNSKSSPSILDKTQIPMADYLTPRTVNDRQPQMKPIIKPASRKSNQNDSHGATWCIPGEVEMLLLNVSNPSINNSLHFQKATKFLVPTKTEENREKIRHHLSYLDVIKGQKLSVPAQCLAELRQGQTCTLTLTIKNRNKKEIEFDVQLNVVTSDMFEQAMNDAQLHSIVLTYSYIYPSDCRMFIGLPVYEDGFINRKDRIYAGNEHILIYSDMQGMNID